MQKAPETVRSSVEFVCLTINITLGPLEQKAEVLAGFFAPSLVIDRNK